MLVFKEIHKDDFDSVSEIYSQGLNTGIATFETEVPDWEKWNVKFHSNCRILAELNNEVAGFAVLSPVSNREVYKGVAEVTIYVKDKHRGKGIGKKLLEELISQSEHNGYWSLQASIFPQNIASIKIHQNCGFRLIGKKEKIGKRHGIWYDNLIFEKRSKINGL